MPDRYPILAPTVLAEGNYATPSSVQLAFNTLTAAVRSSLNTIATGGSFSNVNITGGTIDGVSIGALVPGAGAFTTLSVSGVKLLTVAGFGAVGDGITNDNAAFVTAQGAALFIEVPEGFNCKVSAGLNYWQFYGKGTVFEPGKQWTLTPYPQTGMIAKAYIPRTFGTYEQAVGASITVNYGQAQAQTNTQVNGTGTQGLAQAAPDRDHVALFMAAASYTPDVLDATTTYTATSLTNTTVGALNTAGKIKPGMIIDTLHADICTSRVQSVAGNVITVDAWYARSGGGAIIPATLTGAIINPNNKIFGQNIIVQAQGNGTTTGSSRMSGMEIDMITSTSASPIAGTWGIDVVVFSGSYIDVGYQTRGKRNVSFLSNSAGGAALYGFRSLGDGRAVSVVDPTTIAYELIVASVSKFSVDIAGNLSAQAGTFTAVSGGGGTTAQRPAVPLLYQMYFDTTIGQPIWCTQVSAPIWVNAAGIAV
jgi:hypothetical protein